MNATANSAIRTMTNFPSTGEAHHSEF